MTEEILFSAKTDQAHTFKILIETLNYYLSKSKGGSFVISKDGISLRNANAKEDILCDVSLPAENFQDYELMTENMSDICFSINLNTFYTVLKKNKMKDSITIQILKEARGLFLKIIKQSLENRENPSISRTMVINSSYVPFEPPKGYGLPVNIKSKIFQQSCREITRPTNKEIEIICWNEKSLRFFASKDGVVENEANFYMRDDGKPLVETFKAKFLASHIIRVAKLASLDDNIKIFLKKNLPLCYKTRVGSLGQIEIYIKTLEQVKSEEDTAEDDENDI